jgi:four helix bundle protein
VAEVEKTFPVGTQNYFEAPLPKDFPLRDQMRRSSLSVMSNIAEGFDKGGDREFVQFLFHAKGSCSELRSQLYAANDIGYLDEREYKEISGLAEETSKVLQGLINALKKRDLTGHKFK